LSYRGVQGFSLAGNGTTLATHADRKELFIKAGHLIVDLAKRYYDNNDATALPRTIASFKAFENAIALDIAMGGSDKHRFASIGGSSRKLKSTSPWPISTERRAMCRCCVKSPPLKPMSISKMCTAPVGVRGYSWRMISRRTAPWRSANRALF